MPHRTALKRHVENAKDILKRNKVHHGRASNYLHEHHKEGSHAKHTVRRRIILLREAHLMKLGKLPFFHRLLARKEEISVTHEGRHEKYTLLMNGLQVGSHETRGVVLLDPKMRGMLFFKANSKVHGPMWTPIRNVMQTTVGGHMRWIYIPLGTKPSEYPFYEKLSHEILKREREIDFSKTYREARVAQIRNYL